MPTYEYRCSNCGIFECQQPITAAPLENCPHCGGAVRRLISRNIGIIYKGSGFYTTDYRSSSYRPETEEESPAAKDTASKEKESATTPSAAS